MGKWMELVNVYYKKLDVQWKPAWDDWEESVSPRVVGATWPYGIMWAAEALGPKGQVHFPMLFRVARVSDAYVDESLWLRPEEAELLLDEFRRLRRLCRHEEFIPGVDAQQVHENWRDDYFTSPDEFEAYLDKEEHLLTQAIEHDYWIHLEL